MEPIEAYRDTADRARYFLRLYDGLINIRKRGIRSDWKEAFCRLMHWPKSSQIARIDSRHAVIVLRDGASLSEDDFTKEALNDLLRASIVFGVSALDRYVHERVVKGLVPALRASLKTGQFTREQKEFSLPAWKALEMLSRLRTNRNARPANEIRKYAQEVLHKRTFQSWREIEEAFHLIGVNDFAGQVQTAYRTDNLNSVKEKLSQIIKRRNYIVHEGDLVRHQRAGSVRRRRIERGEVEHSLDFLDDFVAKLDCIPL